MPPLRKRKTHEEDAAWISRSQRKRDSAALQRLAEEIARLSPGEWKKLPLTSELLQALHELGRIGDREARRRHMQYLGRLMREADGVSIASALAALKA